MRKVFIINLTLFVLTLLVSCNVNTKKTPSDSISSNLSPAQFVFLKEIHNFGDAVAGEQLLARLKFDNIGEQGGSITKVITSCDCLSFEFSDEEVLPNEQETLKLIFDTRGEWGNQIKSFEVVTSYGDTLLLTITARVENKQFKNFY